MGIMKTNLFLFGKKLKELRLQNDYSLREICKIVNYDPSNWSKIERGKISPPAEIKILRNWAKILKLDKDKTQEFVDLAFISQDIIPTDISNKKENLHALPAFFRTLRNEKPTKEEIDKLIDLIRNA